MWYIRPWQVDFRLEVIKIHYNFQRRDLMSRKWGSYENFYPSGLLGQRLGTLRISGECMLSGTEGSPWDFLSVSALPPLDASCVSSCLRLLYNLCFPVAIVVLGHHCVVPTLMHSPVSSSCRIGGTLWRKHPRHRKHCSLALLSQGQENQPTRCLLPWS